MRRKAFCDYPSLALGKSASVSCQGNGVNGFVQLAWDAKETAGLDLHRWPTDGKSVNFPDGDVVAAVYLQPTDTDVHSLEAEPGNSLLMRDEWNAPALKVDGQR